MGTVSRISARLLIAFAFSFVTLVHAGDTQDYFINPPDSGTTGVYTSDVTYVLGSTQNITWTTVYTNYSITLWQEGLDQNGAQQGVSVFAKAESDPDIGSFIWTVQTYNFQLSVSNIFYLGVNFPGDPSFTSHYFNISEASPTSTTATSSPTATATANSHTSSSTVAPAPVTTTPTGAPIAQPLPSSLSTGAKAGIGVGVGIIAILGIIGAYFGCRRKRQKRWDGIPKTSWQELEAAPHGQQQPMLGNNSEALAVNSTPKDPQEGKSQGLSELPEKSPMRSELAEGGSLIRTELPENSPMRSELPEVPDSEPAELDGTRG